MSVWFLKPENAAEAEWRLCGATSSPVAQDRQRGVLLTATPRSVLRVISEVSQTFISFLSSLSPPRSP